jgi:hypothetical protein
MQRYGTNAHGQMERDSVSRLLQDLGGGAEPEEEDVEHVIAKARAMPFSTGISAPELIKVLSLWCSRNHVDGDAYAPLADWGCGGLNFGWRRPAAPEPCAGRPKPRHDSDDGRGATGATGDERVGSRHVTGDERVSAFGCASATCAVS